jgi:hypothetical protein
MTITISKPRFTHHYCGHCRCSYSLGSFKVSTQYGEFEHHHDGHLGYGDWDGEDAGMYLLAIKDMFNEHYIHLEADEFTNTFGVVDETCNTETNPNRSIKLLVQESKRKVILEVCNSTYFFPPGVWVDVIEYYEDAEYVDYDVLFKNVFEQLNLLHSDS